MPRVFIPRCYGYHPGAGSFAMRRVYIRDEKKTFIAIGWYCQECKTFKPDGATGT